MADDNTELQDIIKGVTAQLSKKTEERDKKLLEFNESMSSSLEELVTHNEELCESVEKLLDAVKEVSSSVTESSVPVTSPQLKEIIKATQQSIEQNKQVLNLLTQLVNKDTSVVIEKEDHTKHHELMRELISSVNEMISKSHKAHNELHSAIMALAERPIQVQSDGNKTVKLQESPRNKKWNFEIHRDRTLGTISGVTATALD